jgi:hypothetical protein
MRSNEHIGAKTNKVLTFHVKLHDRIQVGADTVISTATIEHPDAGAVRANSEPSGGPDSSIRGHLKEFLINGIGIAWAKPRVIDLGLQSPR